AFSLEFSRSPLSDHEILKTISQGIGVTQLYSCTFSQETNADLFSEQSLLCSILPYAANFSFNKLIEKGIPKELAYIECWYEVKLIADAMVAMGPMKFSDLISPNALLGAKLGKEKIINESFQKAHDELDQNIENHHFDKQASDVNLEKLRQEFTTYWQDQPLTHT